MFLTFIFVAFLVSVPDVFSHYQFNSRSLNRQCDPLRCKILKRYQCRDGEEECGGCIVGYLANDRGKCVRSENLRAALAGFEAIKREKFGASSDDDVIDNLAIRNDLGKEPDVKADVKAPDPKAATPTTTKTTTTDNSNGKPQHQAVQQNPGGNDAGSGVGAGAGSHAGMAAGTLALIMAGCGAAGLVGLIAAGVCWYKLEKNVKDSSEVDYPAYGVTGPQTKDRVGSPTDRKLAQSVQMYHYQHQKQQMIALEKANGEMKHDASDEDSEEENEEGDYTVYECPGLAPTGEMEVKNPLFSEEAPASPGPDKKDGGSAS